MQSKKTDWVQGFLVLMLGTIVIFLTDFALGVESKASIAYSNRSDEELKTSIGVKLSIEKGLEFHEDSLTIPPMAPKRRLKYD